VFLGIEAAGVFIPALKVVNDHFSKSSKPILMGATLAIGILGPLLLSQVLVNTIFLQNSEMGALHYLVLLLFFYFIAVGSF
jgi:hypothetical protein